MLKKFWNRSRRAPQAFSFLGYETDDPAGEVRFHYGYDNGFEFCETLKFGHALPNGSSPHRPEFEAALDALNIAYGIRYYQRFAPPRIVLHGFDSSATQREFFQELYTDGIGEFAYRNELDLTTTVDFQKAVSRPHRGSTWGSRRSAPDTKPGIEPLGALPRISAVLMGGGKDSIVSVEALRAADEPMVLFSLNPTPQIYECARASGLRLLGVHHKWDPNLKSLNKIGGMRGMGPHTAIAALTAVAAAFIYGYDTVVMSNERSADEGNLIHNGREVNHQYTKTGKFEAALQSYIADHITSKVSCFSLLRPLSELHIARLAARSDRYDRAIVSCNETRKTGQWCLKCAKCEFVFLALATAMPPDRLLRIFGANLLDDVSHLQGYEELVGLSGHKPWECVGEVAESGVAILTLAAQPAWRDAAIMKSLAPRLKPLMPDPELVWKKFLTPAPLHHMPPRFADVLYAYAADGPGNLPGTAPRG